MEFSDFKQILDHWSSQRPPSALDCWIDDANARLARTDNGITCSIELLDPYDSQDPQRLESLLSQGGASLACGCYGALAIDPQTRCCVLMCWLPSSCSVDDLLDRLESLANQRAAMLNLMHATLGSPVPLSTGHSTLNHWQPGV